MKKQFFWMRFKAILKIVIPIGIAILMVPMFLEEDDLAMTITICCTMGVAGLIYVISGILTLKNGAKQAREYMRNYLGGSVALDEEYENAEKFSDAGIGRKHLFANASDGFYIIPFDKIESVFVRHEGANPAKGRSGYYYLYVRCDGIGGRDNMIKVYFISKSNANQAMEMLMQRAGIPQEKTEAFVQEEEDALQVETPENTAALEKTFESYTITFEGTTVTFKAPAAFEKMEDDEPMEFAPDDLERFADVTFTTEDVEMFTCYLHAPHAENYANAEEYVRYNLTECSDVKEKDKKLEQTVLHGRLCYYYIVRYKNEFGKFQDLCAACDVGDGKIYAVEVDYTGWEKRLTLDVVECFFEI